MDFRRLWLDDDFRKNIKTLGISLVAVIFVVILMNINWGGNKIVSYDDNVGPKIVRVSSNNMDGVYTINDAIDIVVEFNEEINVVLDGTPRLELQLDNGMTKYATYVDNGSKTEMLFRYYIKKGDRVKHLEYTSEDALDARGAIIKDRVGNVSSLLLPLTSTDNSLGGNKNISFVTDDPYAVITEFQKTKEQKEYTITFNRKVNDFDIGDIQVKDGMPSNFRIIEENRIFKIDVTRTTTLEQTITVPAGVCSDVENGIKNTYSIVIPKGFYYYGGVKENGIVISDNANDQSLDFYEHGLLRTGCDAGKEGNNYVWIPIDYINDTTGVINVQGQQGEIKNSRFGRRDFNRYGYGTFEDYSESIAKGLYESVMRYQGFYVGRYEGVYGTQGKMGSKISVKNPTGYVGRIKTGDNSSRLALYNYVSATEAANAINTLYSAQSSVVPHLPYAAEWDTIMMWFKENDIDVDHDSTEWGNYMNREITGLKNANQQDILNTGVTNQTQEMHIYDLAGNLWEWTQEKCPQGNVVRGGIYGNAGSDTPAAFRTAFGSAANTFLCTSRPFLYIK